MVTLYIHQNTQIFSQKDRHILFSHTGTIVKNTYYSKYIEVMKKTTTTKQQYEHRRLERYFYDNHCYSLQFQHNQGKKENKTKINIKHVNHFELDKCVFKTLKTFFNVFRRSNTIIVLFILLYFHCYFESFPGQKLE